MTRQGAYFLGTSQVSKLQNAGSVVATGGQIRDFWHNGTYWRAHLFLTTGTLTVTKGGEIEYLIVGGGGGGGMDMGGGGGGGGVLFGKRFITPGSHTATVGAGGNGAPRAGTGTNSQGRSAHQYTISATSGGNSIFLGLTSLGGGYGGSSYFNYTPNNGFGANGASGGGASGYSNGTTGRGGTGSQGFNGGGSSGQYYSGGGGGAGQAGGSGTGSGAAKGGDGRMSDILGVQLWWGAGGGGSGYTTNGGNGGRGGGGGGAVGITLGGQDGFNAGMPGGVGSTGSQTNTPGGHAGVNTGSGGGGGSHYFANNSGGNGGAGIVVVRYPLSPGFETPGDVVYETLNVVAQGSGGATITGNGTTSVSFFKTSGSSSWDTQVYSLQPFTAPVTLEFNKLASPDFGDNGLSYAMISLNADPTTNASYTSLDWASYLYDFDIYSVYHNGSQVNTAGTWTSADKFYIVYDTDGFIRHYNGSTLLYQVNSGVGRTVYLDSSLNRVNGGYGGFSNVRVTKNAWNGSTYKKPFISTSIIRDSLVLNLDAGDIDSYPETGTTWFDLSGNGSNASLIGVGYFTDNGGYLDFDGGTDYATVLANPNWAFGQNGTIEQWVYIRGNSGNDRFYCVNNNTSSLDAYLNGTGYTIYFHGGVVGTTSSIPINQWVQLLVTYNAGTISVHFNGVSQPLTGTTTGYNITNGSSTLNIGRFTSAPYELNARMSVMRIYRKGFNATEIQQNFNAQRGRYGI